MEPSEGQGADPVKALLEKSRSKLNAAHVLYRDGLYDDSVSRAYYAVFHALTAALLSKGQSFPPSPED